MSPDSRKIRRLAGIFLLGWILLNYPVLSICNRLEFWGGIPVLYAYVFAAWALIIGLVGAVTLSARQRRGPNR
jgi:hypothetical protein